MSFRVKGQVQRTKLEIRKLSRGIPARLPFNAIAKKTLPQGYELSLVVCTDALARKMNRAYRKKGYAANVLSFPLSTREGEIFLNVNAAKREAKKFRVSLRARLVLLFAHGCLHLKGMKHGVKMEAREERIVKAFS